MIKRKSRYATLEMLSKHPEWNIVDLGCGKGGACPNANVLVDRNNWSSDFPGKEFVVHDLSKLPLPFKDKEFDFCWASHILEHMEDPTEFLKEIVRISKAGYIEVPTPLIDNLVSGDDFRDPHGHKWWIFYDDEEEKMTLRPRRHIVLKTIDIPELNLLYPFFRSSFVLELCWEDSINMEIGDEKYFYEDKEYDLEETKFQPWVMGQLAFQALKRHHG